MLNLIVLRGAVRRIREDCADDVRRGRLDVDAHDQLVATETATLRHHFGLLLLPAGRALTADELGGCLSAAGQQRIELRVAAALAGDVSAALELARALPLARPAVEKALETNGAAPGVARLRALLAS